MSKSETRRTLTKRIILGVVIALVLVYIVFLFITTNFLGTNNIVTETAYRATAYDVIRTTGMIVRDEEYLSSSYDGVLVYNVGDGDSVDSETVIATFYENESDAVATQQITAIQDKVAYLKSLDSVTTSVNVGLDTVESQLNEKLVSLIDSVNSHTFDYISDVEDDLMSSIFRKQMITGEQSRFEDKIAELEEEERELKSSCGSPMGKITAGEAGYFVSSVDGYEDLFDINALDEISVADYQNAAPAQTDGATIGKIIKGVNWYIVCPVSDDEATNIMHNTSLVSIRMPYALADTIPAKVVYVNRFSGEDGGIAVLRCNYMSDALSKIRRESIEIIVDSYEGLKVSKSALHDDTLERTVTDESGNRTVESQKVQGVYVEYGNELVFKQVSIKYSGDDYIICDENPDAASLFNGSTLTLYDRVVVEGDDLFDGKIIQ